MLSSRWAQTSSCESSSLYSDLGLPYGGATCFPPRTCLMACQAPRSERLPPLAHVRSSSVITLITFFPATIHLVSLSFMFLLPMVRFPGPPSSAFEGVALSGGRKLHYLVAPPGVQCTNHIHYTCVVLVLLVSLSFALPNSPRGRVPSLSRKCSENLLTPISSKRLHILAVRLSSRPAHGEW